MKRKCTFVLILIFAVGLWSQSGCQEQAEQPETALVKPKPMLEPKELEPKERAPKIVFEQVILDFGEVGPGTRRVKELKFTNTGNAPLKIEKVEQCCGVTTKLDKTELAPGESGTLTVNLHALARTGLMKRELDVLTNDPAKPKTTLGVKAKIVPKVAYEPKRLQLLLKEENAACPQIKLSSLDGKAFSVKEIKSTGNVIAVDIEPPAKAREFVLEPKVNMDRLRSGLSGLVQIKLTHPECAEITIPFSALPKYKITPPQIIVLKPDPEKPIVRKIWILSNYSEDFEVESTSAKNNLIKVLNQTKIASGYQFEVQITPPAPEETKRFSDTFVINLKNGETLSILLRGFY